MMHAQLSKGELKGLLLPMQNKLTFQCGAGFYHEMHPLMRALRKSQTHLEFKGENTVY